MSSIPPRLHVLLARDARVGVVVRRGPSKQTCTLHWDRSRDTFQVGQWLKGRIYERRSDLSPDGKHLIYFAMNGKWDGEAKGSWTAISRAPYLKAIAIFPKGDCWHGGGLFTGKKRYWLNDGAGHSVLHDRNEVRRDLNHHPVGGLGGECLGVYFPRLLRDGWTLTREVHLPPRHECCEFTKPMGHGWTLRKIAHSEIGAPVGKGCYWDEHELFQLSSGTVIKCPDWEWADLDGNRLVWTEGGQLLAAEIRTEGLSRRCVLHDFNDMAFEPLEAPY